MAKIPTTCHELSNLARAKRADYPLTKGQYKLVEAEQAINKWRDLMMTVAKRIRTGGKFHANESIGSCMAQERGAYLKSILARLAELIGYNILPAIAALEGYGVPKAEVQRLLSRAENAAKRLITDCELCWRKYCAQRKKISDPQWIISPHFFWSFARKVNSSFNFDL